MADPPPVDDPITKEVAQINLKVLGEAPAVAMSSLYEAAAQSIATSMQNAVNAQQHMTTLAQAVTSQSVSWIQSEYEEPMTTLEDLLGAPFMPIVDEENN